MDRRAGPIVSFIVIAFNEEHRISRTLKSILCQVTQHSYEIIVINDGSTDETYKVAKDCLRDFENFKIIDEKRHIGRVSARHLGSSLAAGDYLAFIDSDVELPINWLDTSVSTIQNGIDAVSGIAIPDGDCVVVARISGLSPKFRSGSAKLTGNNLLIRKSALTSVPFRKIPYGDDIRLAWDLELQGFKTAQLSNIVVSHSERKSYSRTLLWQYQQGQDATLLLYEYRKLRLPDSVWLSSAFLAILCTLLWPQLNYLLKISVTFPIFIVLVSVAFVHSRFIVKVFQPRTYFAVLVNTPMMITYLIGRFVGIIVLLKSFFKAGYRIVDND
jgi:glycosyltransferase involved in cell wall biosynthesis